ncbi:hypothetical protein BJ170DRAFT_690592 [Xylariales sp. AK1849]|nr:hypothetical protein BJ170DRAFT_690592 [Xylariales sp. AK1849]
MADPDRAHASLSVVSDGSTFGKFGDLPIEIRYMIWLEAIPRRLHNPRMTGPTFVPKPPLICAVSREARAVASSVGSPHAIDQYNKRPSNCWFTAKRDLVLYENNRIPKQPRHPICNNYIWSDVQSIVVRDRITHTEVTHRNSVIEAVKKSIEFPNVKEILVWPLPDRTTELWVGDSRENYDPWRRKHHVWPEHILDQVFGQDTYRVLDLTKEAVLNHFVALFCGHESTVAIARLLRVAYECYTGLSEVSDYWAHLVEDCELTWLQARYEADKDNDENDHPPVHVKNAGEIDRDNIWIQGTLAKLPKLRPVFLLAKKDDTYTNYGQRRKHPRDAMKPAVVFNDEFKLWMKKAADKPRA